MKRLVLIALIALAACGEDWSGTGTVVGRSYDDADTYMTCQSTVVGKVINACGMQVWHTDPASWHLKFEADGETHSVSVSPYIYETCGEGRTYDTEADECSLG